MTQYGYSVNIDKHCTHSEHEGCNYGSWSESYSNRLATVDIAEQYPDIVSTIKFNNGDTAYVVWAEYSSGDSFGHGDCSGTEVIAIFETHAPAEELAQFLLTVTEYSFDYTTSDGQVHKSLYAPWNGYFESLNEIHVDMCNIGKNKRYMP
jgi:hypothetical protein